MLERSDGATHFQDRSWPRSVSFHNHAPHDVCFRGRHLGVSLRPNCVADTVAQTGVKRPRSIVLCSYRNDDEAQFSFFSPLFRKSEQSRSETVSPILLADRQIERCEFLRSFFPHLPDVDIADDAMPCQSASKKDPLSASKRDPLRRAA